MSSDFADDIERLKVENVESKKSDSDKQEHLSEASDSLSYNDSVRISLISSTHSVREEESDKKVSVLVTVNTPYESDEE